MLLVFEVLSRPGDIIDVCAEGAWHFVAGIENISYGYSDSFSAIVMREHAPASEKERERANVQAFIDWLWPRN